jgi:predicted nucleic acid-binding protein
VIVAFDATVLLYFLDEKAKPPKQATSDAPVARCKERVEYLIASLQASKARIVIPTPVLAEVLVRAGGAASEWLVRLSNTRHFRVAPFDERAAVEFAVTQAERLESGAKPVSTTWAQAKFDAQIMAIAAVEQASVIYSDDGHIKKSAGSRFEVIGIEDLPLPPEDPQISLNFSDAGEDREG